MSNSDNPYAAPESFLTGAEGSYSGALQVDGDQMICVGNRVQLPEICVISGDTDDLVQLRKMLTYAGPVVLIVFLISPLIGAILDMLLKKQTFVTMYVNRDIRSKRRWNMFFGVVFLFAAFGLLVALISSGSVEAAPAWLVVPLAVFIVAIVLMVKGGALLTVKKFEKPDRFWLRGFKPAFFAALARDPQGIDPIGF